MRFQSQKECLFTAGWETKRHEAHLPVVLHSLLRCGLSLCRSPPGPPTTPAPRPPSLLGLRFPAPSAASPGAPGPGVPPHLSALVTVPGTWGPARFPFHSYRGQTFRLPAVISELSREMKIQPQLHCTFPPYAATLALLVSCPLRGRGFISQSTPPPCLMWFLLLLLFFPLQYCIGFASF